MPAARSSAARPTSSACPSTTPSTPRPSRFTNSSATGSWPTSLRAASAIARPIGCSDACSIAPTSRSSAARSTPSPSVTSTRLMRPLVTVPVLSSTTVSMRPVDSSTSGPLIRIPSWAPRPVPTSSAVGVASPSAHGQATISTATAAVSAKPALAPASSQPSERHQRERDHDRHEDRRTRGRRAAAPRPCRSGPRSRGGRSGRAPCRRRPGSRGSRGGRRRSSWPRRPRRPGASRPGIDSPVRSDWSTADEPSSTIAVGRDLLARARDEAIADGQLRDRDAPLDAARVEHRDVLRTELEQRTQRGARASPRASLEVAAGQDERRHDRGDLEVDPVARRLRARARARTASAARPLPAPRKQSATTDQPHAASVPMLISVSIVAVRWRRLLPGGAGGTAGPPRGRRASRARAPPTASSRTGAPGSSRAAAPAATGRAATSTRRPSARVVLRVRVGVAVAGSDRVVARGLDGADEVGRADLLGVEADASRARSRS